jgi:Chaperone of endosialidase
MESETNDAPEHVFPCCRAPARSIERTMRRICTGFRSATKGIHVAAAVIPMVLILRTGAAVACPSLSDPLCSKKIDSALGISTETSTSTNTKTATKTEPKFKLEEGRPATKDWGPLIEYCDAACTLDNEEGKKGKTRSLYQHQIPNEQTREEEINAMRAWRQQHQPKKVEKPIPEDPNHLEPLPPNEFLPDTSKAKRKQDRIIADRVDRIGSTPNIPHNFGPLVRTTPTVAMNGVGRIPAVRVPAPRVPTFTPAPPHVSSTITSDIRLKRDIAELAQLPNGLHLYRFRYRWSDELYVGLMAQEVARVVPDAVIRGPDGYLRVDYNRLGVTFQTWDEWAAGGRSY